MEFLDYLSNTNNRYIQALFTFMLLIAYVISTNVTTRLIKKFGKSHDIGLGRAVYTSKYIKFIAFIISLMLLGIIWDISFKGLSVYFLSFFTVAGIGLFASWSILSNLTAAIILFFYFPFKIGERIRIMDGDNSVEGIIFDLNMFSIIIKNDLGRKVTYPNNMALQKGIIHLKD